VVLGTTGSLLLAVLLNQPIRGVRFYRTIYYLPAVISGVAVAQLWRMIYNPDFGILNIALRALGLRGPGWLADPNWALFSLILISLWGIGAGMIIFLAALQGIPVHLYEAAEMDGAGSLNKFIYITIPMLSPAILFSLITNTIASFQAFTQVFVLTQGGPANATKVYALQLFLNAFQFFKMGYASAMAWILFAIMIVITIVQMKFSSQWVYTENG
jgi:multiple sugar transport system permease protein